MSMAAGIGVDEPRFDISDGTRVAAIGVGSCSHFDEAGKPATRALDDENFRIRALAELTHSTCQVVCGVLRKETETQSLPLGPIGIAVRSDFHSRVLHCPSGTVFCREARKVRTATTAASLWAQS
jgi:hypothetical protein